MSIHFFTGFPGFLGSELVRLLLERDTGSEVVCLVQPKFAALARDRAAALGPRVRLLEGDITAPGLGIGDHLLGCDITTIHHLAAVYDLSVRRDLGMRVNVEGTKNVVEFASACPGLKRLHYVSTCYVSGAHPGVFRESDLDVGQRFNNFYEETKFLAEVEVQKAMNAGLPATIYRPAIVVGDSRTGETQKYDGPYYAIRWILKQPKKAAFLPVCGNPRQVRLNVVPRDFVIPAISYLASRDSSLGTVYQLADPNAPTIASMMGTIARATGSRLIPVPLPAGLAKFAIDRIPGVYRLMQIPSTLVDYLVLPTTYDTANATRDLAGTGIEVPPFRSYAPAMVDFVKRHPDISSAAMV